MRFALFLFMMLATTGFALWKGGLPERLVAGIFLAGATGSMVFRVPYQTAYGAINLEVWIVDVAMLVLLSWIALFAERYWTIWLSSFQLVQVVSHLPELLIPKLLLNVHITIISLWVYPMLLILFVGTWRHMERVRQTGSEPSWSDFSTLPAYLHPGYGLRS